MEYGDEVEFLNGFTGLWTRAIFFAHWDTNNGPRVVLQHEWAERDKPCLLRFNRNGGYMPHGYSLRLAFRVRPLGIPTDERN